MSRKVKFKWTKVEHNMFNKINRIVARNILLAYLDFNKRFEIYNYYSDFQLGAFISQEGKPISFCSRKVTGSQKGCRVTEKGVLRTVKTLI